MSKEYSYFQTSTYGHKNNCTVRAFHHAFGISYDEAYQLLKSHGRKDDKGFVFHMLMWKLKGSYNGIIYQEHPNPHMTVGTFVNTYKVGTYILRYRGHVFTVINGVVHDSFKPNPNKRVLDFYSIGTVENPVFQKMAATKFYFNSGRITTKKTQKSIVLEFHKKGFRTVAEVVAQTGLKKANVAWYFSKLKLN